MGGGTGCNIDIPIGSLMGTTGDVGAFPASGSGYFIGFTGNVKGYNTLTTNNLNYVSVQGIKSSDGSITQLASATGTRYPTIDITDYDYIIVTHGGSNSHTFTFSIS